MLPHWIAWMPEGTFPHCCSTPLWKTRRRIPLNLLKIRSELGKGRSIFDLPLRVTFYARVSTDRDEQ